MTQYDRMALGRQAKDLGFVRDTLEKVRRLTDVLGFLEQDEALRSRLALKGGTAINLTIFDIPRLSVDIDLDFCRESFPGCYARTARYHYRPNQETHGRKRLFSQSKV